MKSQCYPQIQALHSHAHLFKGKLIYSYLFARLRTTVQLCEYPVIGTGAFAEAKTDEHTIKLEYISSIRLLTWKQF